MNGADEKRSNILLGKERKALGKTAGLPSISAVTECFKGLEVHDCRVHEAEPGA